MSVVNASADEGNSLVPMALANGDSWFRLTIASYQFPQITDDEWDSNWLVIDGSARLNGKEWRFRDPCLTTFEAVNLATWMEACAQGTAKEPYCAFTEPNLQFDLVDAQTMRVSFALESAPPWAKQGDDWTKHGFNLSVGPALVRAASELRRQLQNFPVRGGRTRGEPATTLG
ncbi:WapI family immunity protein [Phenylobacterium montanum]|uniref:Uncharacterized protein n=1 Tax=Phenylobacterium montanum TaxID=2823693 RepID=A0A975IV71_9CAUL|nr:hypothetical protein [Caulobacter sp. S6]QUD88274.1 hypothetical protein KCG34_25140 [Caulobacter sp. S6]